MMSSRIERRIPVEVIDPAFVEKIGGEQSSVVVQVIHCGLIRRAVGMHMRLRGHAVSFAQVACGTGRHDVFPNGRAPL